MIVQFIDTIFMMGLVMFLVGGTFFILRQNVFSRTFKNFKNFLKHTSKIESYVEEFDSTRSSHKTTKHRSRMPFFILTAGIVCISISTLLALM